MLTYNSYISNSDGLLVNVTGSSFTTTKLPLLGTEHAP